MAGRSVLPGSQHVSADPDAIGAAAGEDLAIVTNRGDPRITNLGGLGALIDERDIVVVGTRPGDEHAADSRLSVYLFGPFPTCDKRAQAYPI